MSENQATPTPPAIGGQDASPAPVSQSDSTSGSAPVSPTSEQSSASPAESRAEIVARLLERKGHKAPDPPTEAPTDGAAAVSVEVQAPESTGQAASPSAETAKESSKAQNEPSKPTDDGDPALAKRLAKLATAENNLRQQSQQVEQYKAAVEGARKELETYRGNLHAWHEFTKTFVTDPIEAFHKLGLNDKHLDALYWHLNERLMKSGGEFKRPQPQAITEEQARQLAAQEWEQRQQRLQYEQQQQMAAWAQQKWASFVNGVGDYFKSNEARFPTISAVGLNVADIGAYIGDQLQAGKEHPTPEQVLTYFEEQKYKAIEAGGFARKQAQQPRDKAVDAVGSVARTVEDKGGKKRSDTVKSNWSAGAMPSGENDSKVDIRKKSREDVKKKLESGFFSKRA